MLNSAHNAIDVGCNTHLRNQRGNARSEASFISLTKTVRLCLPRLQANVDQLVGVASFRPRTVWVRIPPLALLGYPVAGNESLKLVKTVRFRLPQPSECGLIW